jgi:hypothetical protein
MKKVASLLIILVVGIVFAFYWHWHLQHRIRNEFGLDAEQYFGLKHSHASDELLAQAYKHLTKEASRPSERGVVRALGLVRVVEQNQQLMLQHIKEDAAQSDQDTAAMRDAYGLGLQQTGDRFRQRTIVDLKAMERDTEKDAAYDSGSDIYCYFDMISEVATRWYSGSRSCRSMVPEP